MKYDFYITGTIGVAFDWWTGQRGTTADQVKFFLDSHKDKELNIAVSSPGGLLSDGITIGEYIAAHGKCNMFIIGMTASAATILCMKAKSVKIAKGSLMLIHNASYAVDLLTMANKQEMDEIIKRLSKDREDLDTYDKAIASIYSARNGKTIEENMARMDQNKWMTDQEAVDFGIVDAIIDDDETKTNAKAIQTVYSAMNGIEEHFSLPRLPEMEKADRRSIMSRLKGIMNDIGSFIAGSQDTDTEPQEEGIAPTIHKVSNSMKKIILNLVCALLAVQDFELDENGKATLTEDQLNAIENDLKEKADRISALEADLKKASDERDAAVTAKGTAEQALADLQKEFDDFKGEAGGESHQRVHSHAAPKEPTTAKEMYNSVKNLL